MGACGRSSSIVTYEKKSYYYIIDKYHTSV